MSVAASEAPRASRRADKKKGFDLPPMVEKVVIPLVVLVIAILMPFIPSSGTTQASCSRWRSPSPTW